MPQEIHYKDYPILLALIKKPMGTAEEITREANAVLEKQGDESIKLTENTVARRLKKLFESNAIYGARAFINHEILGLQLYFFLIHLNEVNWEKNAQIVIQFCDNHPYTSFRDRVFGGSLNGIMAYFMLPTDSEALGHLLQCFEMLREKKIITSYTRYQIKHRFRNEANLERFDLNSNQWSIDYEAIDAEFRKDLQVSKKQETFESILPKLDAFDMALIREMTRNSRRPQKQILQEIMDPKHNVGADYSQEFRDHFRDTPQTISRRLKDLETLGVFEGYQLSYYVEDFGMFNSVLYIADRDPQKETALISSMKNSQLPFPSRISTSSDKLIFWMDLPSSHLPRLTNFLMGKFQNLQFFLFGKDVMSYYFWHENYEIPTKSWKVSKEWIIDSPFQEINL